ncbi:MULTISPECIES: hypothetical protein [Paraburkholderia]|uniref:Uncharacterized protein n=1 Tax=Paraburkholderia acidicola TaxID=1912599 RepID=A0ABV1LYN0_9BURK
MFGLYPAGPDWVRHFDSTTPVRALQRALVDHGGFAAGIFHEPFGSTRGAVIAQKEMFLVMSHLPQLDEDGYQLVVVPGAEMQNLLWSFNTGYASQWSAREIRALTGCSGWEDLLRKASTGFGEVCDLVAKAIEGQLSEPADAPEPVADMQAATVTPGLVTRAVPAQLELDDDVPWLPPEYLHDMSMEERP